MPIYLLSALAPTKDTLNELHKIFERFFLSNMVEGRCKHWVAWSRLCYPRQEGGLDFKSPFDIFRAPFATLWWKFRTSNTLWSNFLWIKHWKKFNPLLVQFKGGSQLWKFILEARDKMEKNIWWEPRNGNCSVWYDNWNKLGPLFKIMDTNFSYDRGIDEINFFMHRGEWNQERIQHPFPMKITTHIKKTLS